MAVCVPRMLSDLSVIGSFLNEFWFGNKEPIIRNVQVCGLKQKKMLSCIRRENKIKRSRTKHQRDELFEDRLGEQETVF